MSFYCVQINSILSLNEAWDKLEEQGFSILYGEENGSLLQFYIELFDSHKLLGLEWITNYYQTQLPSIDWEAQWALHGHHYRDGHVHVALSNGKELKLKPGPGFGDLSHPTTALILELLNAYYQQQNHSIVIDIGCGSGILSIAAAILGSYQVYGIDIEPEALKHSKTNACRNEVDTQCHFIFPHEWTLPLSHSPYLILMNMITSEQKIAWNALSTLHDCQGILLTSGIRIEEKEPYLQSICMDGWMLQDERELEGWLAFYFKK